MGRHVARMVQIRNAHKILLANFMGRAHLGDLTHVWEGNIAIGFRETCCGNVNWIQVTDFRIK